MSSFSVEPSAPLTQSQITVKAPGTGPSKVVIRPIQIGGASSFEIDLTQSGSQQIGFFLVSLPGQYEAEWANEVISFQVSQDRQISFSQEFGLLSITVTILFLGVILWNQKQKKKDADGSL